MRKFLRAVKSTILWSYERGSWPYDFMVVLIVLFVLVTPRRWFHDGPQNASDAAASGIVLESDNPTSRTETFRVTGSLIDRKSSEVKRSAELERKIHELLSGSVGDLRKQSFQIRSIKPVRGSDGSVMYYEVQIHH